MTDRVYPSKPKTTTTTTTTKATTTTTTNNNRHLPPPPNKTQFPTTTTNRHPYRPNPTTTHHRNNRRSRGRRCFCQCCFWSFLIITLLLLITTIAACIFYLLYHPHRPSFSIAAVKISDFTLTTSDDTTHLTSKLNLTFSTKNPNKKITFFYTPFTLTLLTHQTQIANGSYQFPITSKPNNITIIHSSLSSSSTLLDPDIVNKIRSDLNKKSGIPLQLLLDTEARVKIESLTSKKVGIRVTCDGIHSLVPTKRVGGRNTTSSLTSSSVSASVTAAKCKLDLRIKIWKWTF